MYIPIDDRLVRFCRYIYRRGTDDTDKYSLAEIYLAMNSTAECRELWIGGSALCALNHLLTDPSFANSPQGFFTRLVMCLRRWVKVRRQGGKLLPLSGEEGLEYAILESIYPSYWDDTYCPGYYTMLLSFPDGNDLRVDETPRELLGLIR